MLCLRNYAMMSDFISVLDQLKLMTICNHPFLHRYNGNLIFDQLVPYKD